MSQNGGIDYNYLGQMLEDAEFADPNVVPLSQLATTTTATTTTAAPQPNRKPLVNNDIGRLFGLPTPLVPVSTLPSEHYQRRYRAAEADVSSLLAEIDNMPCYGFMLTDDFLETMDIDSRTPAPVSKETPFDPAKLYVERYASNPDLDGPTAVGHFDMQRLAVTQVARASDSPDKNKPPLRHFTFTTSADAPEHRILFHMFCTPGQQRHTNMDPFLYRILLTVHRLDGAGEWRVKTVAYSYNPDVYGGVPTYRQDGTVEDDPTRLLAQNLWPQGAISWRFNVGDDRLHITFSVNDHTAWFAPLSGVVVAPNGHGPDIIALPTTVGTAVMPGWSARCFCSLRSTFAFMLRLFDNGLKMGAAERRQAWRLVLRFLWTRAVVMIRQASAGTVDEWNFADNAEVKALMPKEDQAGRWINSAKYIASFCYKRARIDTAAPNWPQFKEALLTGHDKPALSEVMLFLDPNDPVDTAWPLGTYEDDTYLNAIYTTLVNIVAAYQWVSDAGSDIQGMIQKEVANLQACNAPAWGDQGTRARALPLATSKNEGTIVYGGVQVVKPVQAQGTGKQQVKAGGNAAYVQDAATTVQGRWDMPSFMFDHWQSMKYGQMNLELNARACFLHAELRLQPGAELTDPNTLTADTLKALIANMHTAAAAANTNTDRKKTKKKPEEPKLLIGKYGRLEYDKNRSMELATVRLQEPDANLEAVDVNGRDQQDIETGFHYHPLVKTTHQEQKWDCMQAYRLMSQNRYNATSDLTKREWPPGPPNPQELIKIEPRPLTREQRRSLGWGRRRPLDRSVKTQPITPISNTPFDWFFPKEMVGSSGEKNPVWVDDKYYKMYDDEMEKEGAKEDAMGIRDAALLYNQMLFSRNYTEWRTFALRYRRHIREHVWEFAAPIWTFYWREAIEGASQRNDRAWRCYCRSEVVRTAEHGKPPGGSKLRRNLDPDLWKAYVGVGPPEEGATKKSKKRKTKGDQTTEDTTKKKKKGTKGTKGKPKKKRKVNEQQAPPEHVTPPSVDLTEGAEAQSQPPPQTTTLAQAVAQPQPPPPPPIDVDTGFRTLTRDGYKIGDYGIYITGQVNELTESRERDPRYLAQDKLKILAANLDGKKYADGTDEIVAAAITRIIFLRILASPRPPSSSSSSSSSTSPTAVPAATLQLYRDSFAGYVLASRAFVDADFAEPVNNWPDGAYVIRCLGDVVNRAANVDIVDRIPAYSEARWMDMLKVLYMNALQTYRASTTLYRPPGNFSLDIVDTLIKPTLAAGQLSDKALAHWMLAVAYATLSATAVKVVFWYWSATKNPQLNAELKTAASRYSTAIKAYFNSLLIGPITKQLLVLRVTELDNSAQ
jgi:hypothetical protein